MKEFALVPIAGPFSDSTLSYDIVLDDPITTVQEFIDYVLTEKAGEWGNIDTSHGRLKYKYGHIVSDSIPASEKNRIISDAKANGGWTLMNYTIKTQ